MSRPADASAIRVAAAPRSLRHRLFLRIYVSGLIMLAVASAIALTAGGMLFEGSIARGFAGGMLRYLQSELVAAGGQPQALEGQLQRLHDAFGFDLAVYDGAGTLRAAAGVPPERLPVDAPEGWMGRILEEDRAGVRTRVQRYWHGPGGFRGEVPLGSAGETLVVAGKVRHGSRSDLFLVAIALTLGGLALIAWPFARGLSRPLEALTRTARRFGDGDLGARSGLLRHDEIGVLAHAFDEMAVRIEKLVRGERELLANVSHELRTPLARIRVALTLMDEEGSDIGAVRAHLAGVGADLAELEELVEAVLMTARLQRGASELPLKRAPLAIHDVLTEATARFRERFPQHQLDCEPDAEAAARLPSVTGDRVLLRRLVDNLLDNAGRYAGPTSGPVLLSIAREGDGISLEVRDRGPGVDAADLARLFTPFFRADRSRDRHTGGLGLGLALCRRIAEAHGGRIHATLPEGGGLAVRVWIPTATSSPSM